MGIGAVPALEMHRVFRSRDSDEIRAFLQAKDYRFDIVGRTALGLDALVNCVYLPGMYFGYVQYGSTVELSSDPGRRDYGLQIPVRGQIEVTVGRQTVICGSARGALTSAPRGNLMRFEASSSRICVSLSEDAVVRRLSALLDEPLNGKLDFEPALDLSAGYGRSLARYLRLAVLDFEEGAPWTPMMMTLFEELIITRLLLSHPSNYSEALRGAIKPIASRDVKRAIDFIEAHVDCNITLGDIVAASGVPGRTLSKHFEHYRGLPPMQYLRTLRFKKVREALRRAEPEERVTAIALQWGFGHLGRFSVEYRKRFGESPSETLRRRAGS